MSDVCEFQKIERSTPLEEGMTETVMDELTEMLIKKCDRLRGYMLTRNGKVVAEYYRPPYQKEDKVWVYSVSKTFTATAIGIAVDEGRLGLDDKVVDFFEDKLPENPGENLTAMRIRDLLSMSTGHAVDTASENVVHRDDDWIRAFLSVPVVYRPGEHFCYNSGATFILSAILKRVTGEGLLEYLKYRLFQPLGFDKVLWDKNPDGIETGGWGLKVRLEDLTKLGELYRCKGVYKGKRIFSVEWAQLATGICADNSRDYTNNIDWKQGYGFQMWRGRHNTFRADGAVGQFCIVFPDQQAVLTILSETDDMQNVLNGVWDILLPAFNASLQSEEEGRVSQRNYVLDKNERGFTGAYFCFENGELTFRLSARGGEYVLKAAAGRWMESKTAMPIGHSSLVAYGSLQGVEQVISAHYEWTAENTLEINLVWRESPHRDKAICTFEGDTVKIVCPPNASAANVGMKEMVIMGKCTA